jgi:hypothetical protein
MVALTMADARCQPARMDARRFGLRSKADVGVVRRELGGRYRKWSLDRRLPPLPREALVPLEDARVVLLRCSRLTPDFQPQIHLAELAFACEMVAREQPLAVVDDPRQVFDKTVVWFLPTGFVRPPLWDYSRQVHEFARGLEQQGNHLFCSAAEVAFWENKAHMHRELDAVGAPTPRTTLLARDGWRDVSFDLAPVLIKEEHSSGSHGVHYFATAGDARRFVERYDFRPTETLLMQEVVRGATRDLRVTMVGQTTIRSASFWREKADPAVPGAGWTTTATKYNSVVRHGDVPEAAETFVAECLGKLGLRTAGVDLMWVDDEVDGEPLVLEVSPYYQPNPPKPARYAELSYKEYKSRPYAEEGYLSQQYVVFREIAGAILDQHLLAPASTAGVART